MAKYYAAGIHIGDGVYSVYGVGVKKQSAISNARGVVKSDLVVRECTSESYHEYKKRDVAYVTEHAIFGAAEEGGYKFGQTRLLPK